MGTRRLSSSRPGLYVHVPFCEAKCSYCHFAIDPRRPDHERQERYLRALLREMEWAAGHEAIGDADTLYFGGGTPSLLAPARLSRLIDAARASFGLAADAEITIEANPHDLDTAGYRVLREAGVGRLSLGAQSFDDGVLREMGRFHTSGDSASAVERARGAGFDNVSIDLILGWPGETERRWSANLAALASLRPEHVSLYVLEVEGRTELGHRARCGRLDLPDDDLVAALYWRTVDTLAEAGLERYEISNFGRPGRESRHNAKYWDDVSFRGFGMAAHSYLDGRRFWNQPTFVSYCRSVEAEPPAPVAGERLLSPRERASEALFTGLRRRGGIELAAFSARYGIHPLDEYGPALSDAFAAGLVESTSGGLRLTDDGVLLSNEVFATFV
jgi:oxygen-independent coproporphyrinogen III oxidase